MTPEQGQALVKKLKAEIEALQKRRDIAQSSATTMEARNKAAMDLIAKEGDAKRRFLLESAENDLETINQQISNLNPIRDSLLLEVAKLGDKERALSEQIEVYIKQKDDLAQQVDRSTGRLSDMDEQLIDLRAQIKQDRDQAQSIRQEVGVMERVRAKALEDKAVLDSEIEEIEVKIIEADANFKIQKAELEQQIQQTQSRLQRALADLTETANKDKAVRQNWADEQAKIDKRMEVLRRKEAKLSDVEKRVEEYENFMKL